MANKFRVNSWYQFIDKRAQEEFIKDTTLIMGFMHDVLAWNHLKY
jgi:hypothetical protein